ncbi:MAG: methyltransferase family protein [Planctomycetota bacterium]
MLILRATLRALFQVLFFAAILYLPAWTWEWPRATLFLMGYGIVSIVAMVGLALFAPASLEARLQQSKIAKKQPKADKIASLVLGISIFAWTLLVPLDVHHFRLIATPPAVWPGFGAALLAAGYIIMLTAVVQNAYAAPVVADQSERGQIVVDSGLYGLVRHPMYLGFLLFLAGFALWFGSTAALVALPLAYAPFIGRILVEEKTLRHSLPGYDEYTQSVRYRIVPCVW